MAREQLDEAPLTARLEGVVALLQEPSLRLFDDFGDIDARSKSSSHDLADGGCLEVGADGGVDAWMAHFNRHGCSILQHRTMDLADRGSRNGLAFKSGEQVLAPGAQVLPDGLLDLREGLRLGVELQHGEELARLGIEGPVHVGQDLTHFHRDALQFAERLDELDEGLGGQRAEVEVPAPHPACKSTEPDPCSSERSSAEPTKGRGGNRLSLFSAQPLEQQLELILGHPGLGVGRGKTIRYPAFFRDSRADTGVLHGFLADSYSGHGGPADPAPFS
jgi:hypothetical protein